MKKKVIFFQKKKVGDISDYSIHPRHIIKKQSFTAVHTAIMICKRRVEYITHTSDTSLLLPSPAAANDRNEY